MEYIKTLISIFIIIGPAFYFGHVGKSTEMGIAVVAGSIAAGFLNIDKMELLKGAGFEARIKAVDKAVNDVYTTIDEYHRLGKMLVLSLQKLLVYGSRLGGLQDKERFALFDELNILAKDLALDTNSDFIKTYKTFRHFYTRDSYYTFIREVQILAKNHSHLSVISKELDSLQSLKEDYPSHTQIYSILAEHLKELSPEALELLEDYLYYKDTGKIRRPEKLSGYE